MKKLYAFLLAFTIKVCIDLPMQLLGLFMVPFGIKYGFKGFLWPWGNDDHPDNGGSFWHRKCGESWWCAYQWFALRNPTFNMGKYWLGAKFSPYVHDGDAQVGDKTGGGSYWCWSGWRFEYYLIVPYVFANTNRCVRIRFGWKMYGKKEGDTCQFCFVVNPFMPYSGVNHAPV